MRSSLGWIGNYGLKQKALVIFLFLSFCLRWGWRPGPRQAERSAARPIYPIKPAQPGDRNEPAGRTNGHDRGYSRLFDIEQ